VHGGLPEEKRGPGGGQTQDEVSTRPSKMVLMMSGAMLETAPETPDVLSIVIAHGSGKLVFGKLDDIPHESLEKR
jgi:hypothetical protein